MKTLEIADREVGAGKPVFIVAEIGINHNGDLALAKEMVDAAAQAGADAVKFQNYQTEDFISDKTLTYEYVSQGTSIVEAQYDMFKRCELSAEDLAELKGYCDTQNVSFHSTPTSTAGVDLLVDLGVPLLKNGSDYLTHLPLIEYMGKTSLPTVLSTGMATLAEVDDAVRAFRATGNDQLILLHCTSAYPTPPDEVHINQIPTLAAAFKCHVGFSDHTQGVTASIGAVTLGACWLEKHFTLDKTLFGPDHRFSAAPAEFELLVKSVREIEQNLGRHAIGPSLTELENRQSFRLSCVAAEEMKSGHTLRAVDIEFRRPGTGLPPKAQQWLPGRRLRQSVSRGHVFTPGDFV